MCHVAPQAITVWYFQAMVTWLYESCSSAPESAKFKLANEVAVLESAKFELSNDKELPWFSPNLTTDRQTDRCDRTHYQPSFVDSKNAKVTCLYTYINTDIHISSN